MHDSGGAQVQFVIRVVAVPVNMASLASVAKNMSSFASVFWESDVGLVAPVSDMVEAIRTMWAVSC